jgi:hypothetical protein
MSPGTPLQESGKESSSTILKLRETNKRLAKLLTDIPLCDESSQQETMLAF